MTTPANYLAVDAYEVEAREMDALKVKVTLGYARMQLYNGAFDFVWKKYNDRNITSARKREMYESFKENGVLVVKTDATISIAMDESWFKTPLYVGSLEGCRMEDIPELELTEEGQVAMEAEEFCPLEGLGRMGGVELLWKEMEAQKTNKQASVKKLKEAKGKTDHSAEIRRLEREVAYITQRQKADTCAESGGRGRESRQLGSSAEDCERRRQGAVRRVAGERAAGPANEQEIRRRAAACAKRRDRERQ
jgi:hypothetical protein